MPKTLSPRMGVYTELASGERVLAVTVDPIEEGLDSDEFVWGEAGFGSKLLFSDQGLDRRWAGSAVTGPETAGVDLAGNAPACFKNPASLCDQAFFDRLNIVPASKFPVRDCVVSMKDGDPYVTDRGPIEAIPVEARSEGLENAIAQVVDMERYREIEKEDTIEADIEDEERVAKVEVKTPVRAPRRDYDVWER